MNFFPLLSRAEAETKLKLEKQTEIRKINVQISALKADIAKLDEKLEECKKYKEFLDSLTPPEWIDQHLILVYSKSYLITKTTRMRLLEQHDGVCLFHCHSFLTICKDDGEMYWKDRSQHRPRAEFGI